MLCQRPACGEKNRICCARRTGSPGCLPANLLAHTQPEMTPNCKLQSLLLAAARYGGGVQIVQLDDPGQSHPPLGVEEGELASSAAGYGGGDVHRLPNLPHSLDRNTCLWRVTRQPVAVAHWGHPAFTRVQPSGDTLLYSNFQPRGTLAAPPLRAHHYCTLYYHRHGQQQDAREPDLVASRPSWHSVEASSHVSPRR